MEWITGPAAQASASFHFSPWDRLGILATWSIRLCIGMKGVGL